MTLKQGTILITGGTSGFGLATARLLRKSWPQTEIWITGRRQDRLDAIVSELGKNRVRGFAFDIRDRQAVEKFASENNLKQVSVLINNAGLAAGLDPFHKASVDDWEQMIDTNLKGLLYITRAIIPHMMEAKLGHIINMGSIAGHIVYPQGHVYNATKFAVHALTQALRMDVLGSNIRVTTIDPGMAETEFSLVRFKGDAEKAKSVYQGIHALSPQDIAEAILWTLDRPSHVTIQEMIIMPTNQAGPQNIHREKNA